MPARTNRENRRPECNTGGESPQNASRIGTEQHETKASFLPVLGGRGDSGMYINWRSRRGGGPGYRTSCNHTAELVRVWCGTTRVGVGAGGGLLGTAEGVVVVVVRHPTLKLLRGRAGLR